MEERHRRLVRLLRERTGEALRGVISYDADDIDVLYVREDLATGELREALPEGIRRLRERGPIVPETYATFGDYRATTEVYDGAVLLDFPTAERAGVLVTLNPDAATQLSEFVSRCSAVLRDD